MNHAFVRRVVIVALACGAGVVGIAQQRAPLPAPLATSEISGVVVSNDAQPSPMRRAIVTISSDALTYARSVITDDAGGFSFARLPAGAYTIVAKKAAYLVAQYGSVRPGSVGSRLALAAGERRTVTLTMFRGAALGGVLTTQNGGPLAGVTVMAITTRTLRDNDRLDPEPTVTNDRGEYRIFGLTPGEYVVVALPGDEGTGEIGARSAGETDALLALVAQRKNVASPIARSTATEAFPVAARILGYSPIYYPGTPLATDAEPIRLAAGDDRSSIRFTVPRVPVATIEGTITGDLPSLASVQLAIVPEVMRLRMRGKFPSFTAAPPNEQGQFKYGNLSPGHYQIVARVRNPAGEVLYATAELDIRGQNLSGLNLTLQPGGSIEGVIVFDSARAPVPADSTRIRVGVAVATGTAAYQVQGLRIGNILADVPLVNVGANGTFRIGGIGPTRYTITATLPPDLDKTWTLRSAMAGDRDLLDGDVNGFGVQLQGVMLTFSDKRTELSGSLLSESGQPANQYYVIAFSANRANWRPGSRRTVSVRPATDGHFVFPDLPAGDYLIAALTDVDPDQWQEAAFLEQVAPVALKLSLAEGEKKRQDLRIK